MPEHLTEAPAPPTGLDLWYLHHGWWLAGGALVGFTFGSAAMGDWWQAITLAAVTVLVRQLWRIGITNSFRGRAVMRWFPVGCPCDHRTGGTE